MIEEIIDNQIFCKTLEPVGDRSFTNIDMKKRADQWDRVGQRAIIKKIAQ